jgi:hypothetical protein
VLSGGTVSPGSSIGKIALSNSPSLQGNVVMEITKNPVPMGLAYDQITVEGTLTYSGSLIVTNLGSKPLAAGESIKLFNATAYSGSFSQLSLPPISPELTWTNKLLVDGSLEVTGVPLPMFASITVSGTNVILTGTNGPADALYAVLTATNLALPLSNWVSIDSNVFGTDGEFDFTTGLVPGERQRFFRIRTP